MILGARIVAMASTRRVLPFRLDDRLESLPVHCDHPVKLGASLITCSAGVNGLSNQLIERMTNRGP